MRNGTLLDFESDHSLSEIPLWGFASAVLLTAAVTRPRDLCPHCWQGRRPGQPQVQHRAEKGLAVVSGSGKTSLEPLLTLLLLKDMHDVDDMVSQEQDLGKD